MTKDYFDIADHEFDNTKISGFLTCPALGYWRWIRGIDTLFPNGHLIFGTACHEGSATWNRGTMNLKCASTECLNKLWLNTLNTIANEMAIMPEGYGSKNLQTVEKLVDLAKDHPELQGKIIAVEQRYEKYLFHQANKDIIYFGKVDLWIQRTTAVSKPISWIVDYKTTGNLDTRFFDVFFLNRQPRGYLWLTGVRNFLVTVLHVIKGKCAYTNQQGPCIHSQEYTYRDYEIDMWEQETIAIIKEIYRKTLLIRHGSQFTDYELFPKAGTRCQQRGGCVYQRLCEQSCKAEDVMIDYAVFKEV